MVKFFVFSDTMGPLLTKGQVYNGYGFEYIWEDLDRFNFQQRFSLDFAHNG